MCENPKNHAEYITALFNPQQLQAYAEEIAKAITKDKMGGMKIDAIAVRGISGIVMGSVVSMLTQLPLVIVRKTYETHSRHMVEFGLTNNEPFNYVIIDDIIASGRTILAIKDKIAYYHPAKEQNTLQKIYLYEHYNRQNSEKITILVEEIILKHANIVHNKIIL